MTVKTQGTIHLKWVYLCKLCINRHTLIWLRSKLIVFIKIKIIYFSTTLQWLQTVWKDTICYHCCETAIIKPTVRASYLIEDSEVNMFYTISQICFFTFWWLYFNVIGSLFNPGYFTVSAFGSILRKRVKRPFHQIAKGYKLQVPLG